QQQPGEDEYVHAARNKGIDRIVLDDVDAHGRGIEARGREYWRGVAGDDSFDLRVANEYRCLPCGIGGPRAGEGEQRRKGEGEDASGQYRVPRFHGESWVQ